MQHTVTRTDGVKAEVEIGIIVPSEMPEAVAMLARGMRDNPLHLAVFGDDPGRREALIERTFAAGADTLAWHAHMLVARDADGRIVGACGMQPPGKCQPTPRQSLRLLPAALKGGPGIAGRTFRWLGAWSKQDPKEPHWHVGPLGVDAHLQGQGIGSSLMRVFCAQMDAAGDNAYLETDKSINVRFYEKFGFEVVHSEDVLGVTSWYMIRRPASHRVESPQNGSQVG